MITAENLVKANEGLALVDIKGKQYAMVKDRVKAFRQMCPNGSIISEIVHWEDGVIGIKATVSNDEGQVISTGIAYEKEQSSFINKTSYVENAETSAIGRALGFCGIGIDDGMGSADEMTNAIVNQDALKEIVKKVIGKSYREQLLWYCNKECIDLESVANEYSLAKGDPDEKYHKALLEVMKKHEAIK